MGGATESKGIMVLHAAEGSHKFLEANVKCCVLSIRWLRARRDTGLAMDPPAPERRQAMNPQTSGSGGS